MSDLTTIIARIDALQAAVQSMANSLAAKADKTNKTLDPANKDGLQAAGQKMANAIAGQLNDVTSGVDAAVCKTQVIMEHIGVPIDEDTGLYPCSGVTPGNSGGAA